MQYPSMSRTREYRVEIPTLNGGVNLSVPPHMVSDNQLTEVLNMWYRDGRLQTRPALSGIRIAGHAKGTTYRYGRVGDYGYIMGFCNAEDSQKYRYLTLVLKDGNVRPHPKAVEGKVQNMMVASANDESEKVENVLVYVKSDNEGESGVFSLNNTDAHWTKKDPYIPTVIMNIHPSASAFSAVSGVQLEPYNMLTNEYKCTYTPDGAGLYYSLPENAEVFSISFTFPTRSGNSLTDLKEVKVSEMLFDESAGVYHGDGGHASGYIPVYNKALNCVYFCEQPIQVGQPDYSVPVAVRECTDNSVVIRIKRTDDEWEKDRDTILGMQFSTWYGGSTDGIFGGTRMFVGGNPDCPNKVYWSSVNNPLYFPQNNFSYIGEDTNAVTAFGKQSDVLVIFKERELYYTTYVRGGTVTAEELESQAVVDIEAASATFPLYQLHPSIGCDCPRTIQLCNNRLVWLNSDGKVYGLFSAGIYSERNLRELSLQIEKELRRFSVNDRKNATAACYEQQYILLVGGEMIAMDFSSYGFNYYGSYSSYEKAQKNVTWHIWKTNALLRAVLSVGETTVVIGTNGDEERRHTFVFNEAMDSDDIAEYNGFKKAGMIENVLETKHYDFGVFERLKRINTMTVHASGTPGATVHLEYINGDASYEKRDRLILSGEPLDTAKPQRRMPNVVRARQFGFRLTCDGRVAIGGFVLYYSTMGVVR